MTSQTLLSETSSWCWRSAWLCLVTRANRLRSVIVGPNRMLHDSRSDSGDSRRLEMDDSSCR